VLLESSSSFDLREIDLAETDPAKIECQKNASILETAEGRLGMLGGWHARTEASRNLEPSNEVHQAS
jgi:hypothetical protein